MDEPYLQALRDDYQSQNDQCGFGNGDSELFAKAAGYNYSAETSVGEFVLGSLKEDVTNLDVMVDRLYEGMNFIKKELV